MCEKYLPIRLVFSVKISFTLRCLQNRAWEFHSTFKFVRTCHTRVRNSSEFFTRVTNSFLWILRLNKAAFRPRSNVSRFRSEIEKHKANIFCEWTIPYTYYNTFLSRLFNGQGYIKHLKSISAENNNNKKRDNFFAHNF
jgi:hypothetical protein